MLKTTILLIKHSLRITKLKIQPNKSDLLARISVKKCLLLKGYFVDLKNTCLKNLPEGTTLLRSVVKLKTLICELTSY